ncbi:MAG: hypothetical protein PHR45_02955 [Muribaculaceae bacterium]|nr:hypothetical protein [Muribaculaceae bacterium]
MKSIFIAFDQAHYENIIELLEKMNSRGFTAWEHVQGRGTKTGDPHYGSHAWPSLASSILTIVDDDKVDKLLQKLKELDDLKPMLGLRAWVWNIENSI